jgi:hypothetical protein
MSDHSPLLERGVYRAPVLGPNAEIVLFAVDSRHRVPDHGRAYLRSEVEVLGCSEALHRLLDVIDPQDVVPLPLRRLAS